MSKEEYHVSCLREPVSRGDIEAIDTILNNLSPDDLQAALEYDNYRALDEAGANGHVEVFRAISGAISPDKLQDKLAYRNYLCLASAATHCSAGVVSAILDAISPDNLHNALASTKYRPFECAVSENTPEVAKLLLDKAVMLSKKDPADGKEPFDINAMLDVVEDSDKMKAFGTIDNAKIIQDAEIRLLAQKFKKELKVPEGSFRAACAGGSSSGPAF